VLDSRKGTAARVRVLVEWSDHRKSWSTVGVSDNILEASYQALVDAIRYKLLKDKKVTEDEEKRAHDEIQKLTDSFMEKLDAAVRTKEKEILEIR
jgi:2-isopropylmalate synthase